MPTFPTLCVCEKLEWKTTSCTDSTNNVNVQCSVSFGLFKFGVVLWERIKIWIYITICCILFLELFILTLICILVPFCSVIYCYFAIRMGKLYLKGSNFQYWKVLVINTCMVIVILGPGEGLLFIFLKKKGCLVLKYKWINFSVLMIQQKRALNSIDITED